MNELSIQLMKRFAFGARLLNLDHIHRLSRYPRSRYPCRSSLFKQLAVGRRKNLIDRCGVEEESAYHLNPVDNIGQLRIIIYPRDFEIDLFQVLNFDRPSVGTPFGMVA